MSELVKVSSKGLLTLPKSIREQLDINIGDYLDITIETGKVVLQKIDITPTKIDWENDDKAWKKYSVNKIAREQ